MITKVVSESLKFLPGEVLHLIITVNPVVDTIGSNFEETDLKRLSSQMNTWQIRLYVESGLPDPKQGSLNYSTTLIPLHVLGKSQHRFLAPSHPRGCCSLNENTRYRQSCLTLCDTMDCSLSGSSVHGILQARILEWVAMPSSRSSSWPRD